MSYEVTGTVVDVYERKTFRNNFTKREFILETEEKYPQKLKFQLLKDNSDLITGQDKGKRKIIHFNIKGSEYKDNIYTNLTVWKVESPEAGQSRSSEQPPTSNAPYEEDPLPM